MTRSNRGWTLAMLLGFAGSPILVGCDEAQKEKAVAIEKKVEAGAHKAGEVIKEDAHKAGEVIKAGAEKAKEATGKAMEATGKAMEKTGKDLQGKPQ
jgi:hypothetical protein